MQLKTIVLSAILALVTTTSLADKDEDRRSGQVTAPVATDMLQLDGTLYKVAPGVSVQGPEGDGHTMALETLEPGMSVDFTVSDPGNPPLVPPTIDHLRLVND